MSAIASVSAFLLTTRRTIVSVAPIRLFHRARHAHPSDVNPGKMAGYTNYELPPAPRGGFTKLVVTGALDIGVNQANDPPTAVPNPLDTNVIAQELVRIFSTHTRKATLSLGLGVFVADEPEATDEQIKASPKLAEARAKQEEYFRMLVYEGDELNAKGMPVDPIHRAAAIWMGAEDRPWVKEISEKQVKTCPACGEPVLANALVCKHCSTDLIKWGVEYGVDRERDPVVWQRVQTLMNTR